MFDAARIRGELSVQDLWLRFLASGGHGDLFDVDAHLHGVAPLSSFERDVLAYALNERLDEMYDAARVPYLTPGAKDAVSDLETVIAELFDGLTTPGRAESPTAACSPQTQPGTSDRQHHTAAPPHPPPTSPTSGE